ncbi:aspartate aminotransferase family protein [Pelagicoccus sp. SDUM812003]|uniref:aspartate aminotransferase family protein n=1 Tax=Pelagicoccus sp. SDUM812003 TaxID=3041267 RepID=UPI00280CE134|nr:aspartate aminotransferase family protein [Pelagicoccus sp. SDUM812003]MDQ8204193.1 aspartate aminotransferase family protein [Pelagicoccus sp. SDUM812003]
MTTQNTEQLYKDNVLGNYGLPPITFTRGRGVRVWDDAGKEYIDFCSGIAVLTLGHSHPKHVSAIQAQAAELIHVSNLYRNQKQALLAAELNRKAGGGGKVFFCNSGAEANEALIKLSRLYGKAKSGQEAKQFKVIVAEKAFHGRTFGGMSATPQEKIQGGFRPLVPGFETAPLNDLPAFEKAVDESTSAIFVETIQGEGGVNPCEIEFLQGLRALCDEKGILLLIDEVQCGIGRSGTFFAFEEAGIRPDAIGMAKGLGGGVPIGAVWIDDKHASLFHAGSHGTTFGGTPLICAAALATLEVLDEEQLLQNVRTNGTYFVEQLAALKAEFPSYVLDVRGRGYMLGIQIAEVPLEMVVKLREAGLVVPPAGGNVIRFLPPLIASKADIDEALAIVKNVVASRVAELSATPA